jgi:hypothetical protein
MYYANWYANDFIIHAYHSKMFVVWQYNNKNFNILTTVTENRNDYHSQKDAVELYYCQSSKFMITVQLAKFCNRRAPPPHPPA